MRRLLFLVGAIVLIETMLFSAITPLLPDYVDRLGLSTTAAGILSGAYAAGTLLASIPSGVIAACWGARRTVLLGLTLMALASLGFAFGRDIAVLDLARFLQGVGGACSFAGGLAWLVAQTPADRRGATIGAAFAATGGGVVLGPVLGAVAREVGTTVAFGAIAPVSVVLIAAALATEAPAVAGRETPLRAALAAPSVRGGMALVLVPSLGFGAINVLAPLELDRLGATGAAIGATFLVAAAIDIVVQVVVGRASDRRGRRPLLLASLGGAIAFLLLLPLPRAAWLLMPLVVVAIVMLGSTYTPATALLSDAVDASGLDQGMGFGLMNLAWAGGQMLGALGGSGLADLSGVTAAYLVLAALLAVAFAALARRRPAAAPVG